MSTEIPIWVNGKIRWLAGIDKKTTCKDAIEVLLEEEGIDKSEVKDFAIMERWRKVERPLDENSKILKIWSHWGNEKKEVRLCLRRTDNQVDSGRGSPVAYGTISSLRRKRNRARGNGKPPWIHPETLHPRRLAELEKYGKKDYEEYYQAKVKLNGTTDNYDQLKDNYVSDNKLFNYENVYDKTYENVNDRKKLKHKSYHCSGTGRLHSTLLSNSENYSKRASKCCSKKETKQKVRNSENIEKLMKLILAQGATIQNQLQKLKEREEQIESLEHERHRERIEKNGRNYLLETYLGSLKDAEIPVEIEEKKEDNEVGIEPDNYRIIPMKKQNNDGIKQNKTEFSIDESTKIYERGQPENRIEDGNSQPLVHRLASKIKSTRSKSESRTCESKSEGNLKRTFSDNAIAETNTIALSDKDNVKPDEMQNTKEESEEIIELRRIQSQIEMWEKVFKINKKLEKEEENLVRLHIKLKKCQSENYRIAKERFESNEKQKEENKEEIISSNSGLEVNEKVNNDYDCKKDCEEMQKKLKTLRSDLEQNSKEIYQNFTKLIEDDERAEQKRSCLTKLISDLERTNHEHDMLNEMIAMRENQKFVHNQVTSFCENPEKKSHNYGNEKNTQNFSEYWPISVKEETNSISTKIATNIDNKNKCSAVLELPIALQDNSNQRQETDVEQEKLQQTKPKIVKISFEDKIQNYNSLESGEEKFFKEPIPITSGALKSILKTRKQSCDKDLENFNEFSQSFEFYDDKVIQQNNLNTNRNFNQIQSNYPSNVPNQITSNYSFALPYSLCNNFQNNTNQNYPHQTHFTKFPEDLKTASYPIKNPHSLGISKTATNVFPHNTIVTTKALVHNDTDSSTSSDTSGLSSMYSSSPTVEETYVEHSYVLDTLV